MNYSEAAYFDGNHCANVAARNDNELSKARVKRNRAALADYERRTGSRARYA